MIFQASFLINGFAPGNAEYPIVFPINVANQQQFILGKDNSGKMVCNVILHRSVAEKITRLIRALPRNCDPVPFGPVKFTVDEKTPVGETLIFPSGLDPVLETFANNLHRELADCVTRFLTLLRWRFNLASSGSSPIGTAGFFWSEDGTSWFNIPRGMFAFSTTERGMRPIGDTEKEEIRQLFLNDELEEPFAHVLLREARSLANSHRRSSLMMAVASIEIGVKSYIKDRIPDAAWLVDEIQSPPVVRLLSEFIPKLPAKLTVGGKVLFPDHQAILKKAVQIRNLLAHKSKQLDVDTEYLLNFIAAMQDDLWLFDYYCGNEWALNHISSACQNEIDGLAGNEAAVG